MKNLLRNLFGRKIVGGSSQDYKDYHDFKSEISWFIKPGANVELSHGSVSLDDNFPKTFPTLSNLIQKARVTGVKIDNKNYKLYAWTSRNGESCGWLCNIEGGGVSDIQLLDEHQLLLDNIGGIEESFNQPENAYTNNQNFLFIKSRCNRGLSWREYYEQMCGTDFRPMAAENLVSFVQEANGSETLYDMETKQLYLFSHDHAFDYVSFVDGQPRYTFHYINGVNNFVDYVETVAKQWSAHLQNPVQ